MQLKKLLLIVGIIFIWSTQSEGQNTLTPQNLFDMKMVSEVAVSPDQTHIAYALSVPRPFGDEAGGDYRELHVYDIDNQVSMPFITGNKRVFSLDWTPDGSAITFRASFTDQPGVQVYAINLKGGEAYPLTEHTSNILSYEFIDDNSLAITALEHDEPMRRILKQRGFDIDVYEEEYRHRNLYVYELDTHHTRQVTDGVTVFDFVLSPDKATAAAAIAPRNLVDDSYMFKRIHLVDMETGETTLLVENPGKLGNMAWSPDGTKLAFRAASKLKDAVVGSLFVTEVPSDKEFEDLRNYAEGMELSIIDFAWKDNRTLLYAAEEGVDIVLSEQRIDRDARNILIEPEQVVFSRFHHVDGLIAFAGNTPEHPSELYSFTTRRNRLNRLTHTNPWMEHIELSQQRKVVYDARDGKDIEGVLLYPLNYEEGEEYPLIVYIHGGPEAAVQNGWSTFYSIWGQVATARDYFVFMPNYRASSGRGVDFTMAGYGDLVGVEYDDVLDGIDHLIDIGYVDEDRVGMGGGSYGGYFSAWSATRHTERFAASVVFVGISNQISKRNTTDIPWEDYYVHWGYWTHENWEDVYSRSPVKYAPGSQTPTLVLHGADDPRVHPSQGLELYRSLKLHGEAPVRLIWYNGEGHGNSKNVHRLDYIVRTMEWFDYYLQSDEPKDQMPDKYPDYQVFD